MSTVEIFLLVFVFVVAAARLYQKYVKKNDAKSGQGTRESSGSLFTSSSKDDEYEPYSKK